MTGKLAAGYAVRTIARLRTALNTALGDAVRHDLLYRNVARLVRAPKGDIARRRSLALDEARLVLQAIRGHRLEAAFTIQLLLGLRPGEVLGLRWHDIDLATSVLRVEHALKREATGLRLGTTKTPESRRRLALPDRVIDSLRRRQRAQASERTTADDRWIEQDFVFTTPTGGPVDHSRLRADLSDITTAIGLGHWHPHELRHSAVSLLSAAGVRLEDVADLMGHRSTRTTSGVYRHVVVPVIDAAVASTDELYRIGA
jgi:integrase